MVTEKEFYMKKITGKIAMFLILVMLGSMFTGCFTDWLFKEVKNKTVVGLLFLPFIGLDVTLLPITLPYFLNHPRSVYAAEDTTKLPQEERAFLAEKTVSLPEADGAFLTALITALPEAEQASVLELLNAVPEQRFHYVVKAMRVLYALPQDDHVFLVEAIRSLPEKEQLFITETANSLTDMEIAALADEFSSISAAELTYRIQILRETPSSEWGYREYAAERFVRR
jgi:hypothetical protein